MENKYGKFLKIEGTETWQEALERLKKFCHEDLDEYEDDDGEIIITNFSEDFEDIFEISNLEKEEKLNEYEENYEVKIPKELRELMSNYGLFKINGWGGGQSYLEIYSSKDECFPNIKKFTKGIEFNYGPYPLEYIPTEYLEILNEKCLFFGVFWPNPQKPEYLYFTPQGEFGIFSFDEGDIPNVIENSIKPILDNTQNKYSLDRLISTLINKTMLIMLEQSDVPVDQDLLELIFRS